jgi:Zn-dependent protease
MSRQDFDFGGVRQYLGRHVDTLQNILFVAPVLLFSVVAHEYAHGYAALRQGDPTALQLGRLTLNPIKHIDPFLTIIMPVVMLLATDGRLALGGAKPVPVNPANYRHPKRGDIIVSLAGVTVNLVLALLCTLLIAGVGLVGRGASALGTTVWIAQVMLIWGVTINLVLIAFNLIPIPPLDGSHVVKYLLPASWAVRYQQLARYGIIVLIALLYFGSGLLDIWMRPAILLRSELLTSVASYIHPSAVHWFQ